MGPTESPVHWLPGSFPGGTAAGAWCRPLTPSSADVKERVHLYLYPLWVHMAGYRVKLKPYYVKTERTAKEN
jgi:hypothetical protein